MQSLTYIIGKENHVKTLSKWRRGIRYINNSKSKLSKNINSDFVVKTIKDRIEKVPDDKRKDLIIHSDRGTQYTCKDTHEMIESYGANQSMSRPGTPLDNAVVEGFFGHMKDELDYKKCKSFSELSSIMDAYMCNYHRPQWSKSKMTPVEYKNYLIAS